MSTLTKNTLITPEEYLEGEQYSDIKHEYVDGHIYAMVGSSSAHNLIAGNLLTLLKNHLRGKPCQAFISDMKARINNIFYYPDVMVACDPQDRHDYYREHPILIIEVLSPSTTQRDSHDKRNVYQSIASLREYVLVSQDMMAVRIYRRSWEGWSLESCLEGDKVRLTSVDLELPIEAIYEEVWE